MSLLNKTPFLNEELAKLSTSELETLGTSINGSEFSFKTIDSLAAGDKMKALNLELTGRKTISGWFLGTSFIEYAPNRSMMQMWKVDLTKHSCEPVEEYFTATDLRQLVNDKIDEHTDTQSIEVANIQALTKAQLDSLKPGDAVIKITGNAKHTYIVSYKGEGAGQGICLTYCDAGYSETVSYDRSGTSWVYNSTDVVVSDLTSISGYDATKTQTLKNVSGTLTWVTDE